MFTGVVRGPNDTVATTDVAALHQAREVFTGEINLHGHGNSATFTGDLDVQSGETVDFDVGFGNGNWGQDHTSLDATITR